MGNNTKDIGIGLFLDFFNRCRCIITTVKDKSKTHSIPSPTQKNPQVNDWRPHNPPKARASTPNIKTLEILKKKIRR
jgi:hypothetical protein